MRPLQLNRDLLADKKVVVKPVSRIYDELAWIYDAAFSWSVDGEVDWLLDRFGDSVRRILDVGCGSGRFMPAFAKRGIEVVGVDRSESMLIRARERMRTAGLDLPRLECADMSDFAFGAIVDGAFCAINTFGYLQSRRAAEAHLECVHKHIPEGGRYLVQLGLRSPATWDSPSSNPPAEWVAESDVGRVRCRWSERGVDTERHIEQQIARFEIITGKRAGEVHEEVHEMRLWDWAEWQDLVHGAHFEQLAAYDGGTESRSPLSVDSGLNDVHLVWHELVCT